MGWWDWFDDLWGHGGTTTPTTVASVPEIDASTGLLAVAALVALLALAWERRRRQA